ncbi:MAG: TetR/AcrR family transcriptional regulator [Tomitella sp.]|nr:TetR/AcrR family transcriptional regulator [Tomitella sp.]
MKSRHRDTRPVGRDAVRRSILHAAREHFARHGLRASLRDIAETADVNVGLIHRHFGRKDQLVREVIEHTLDSSSRDITALTTRSGDTDPTGEAVRTMFLGSTEHTDFVRMIAWLSLEAGPDGDSPLAFARNRTIGVLREADTPGDGAPGGGRPSDPGRDARLMTALTVIYGWSVFSREMLSALDVDDDRRGEFERRIADVLAEMTAGTFRPNKDQTDPEADA